MSIHSRMTCLLVAALSLGFAPLVMAWTPYGYDPYVPGPYRPYAPAYQGGYPQAAPPAPPAGTAGGEPALPPTGNPGQQDAGYSGYPYQDLAPGAAPPAPEYPGYGPWSGPPWGYRGPRADGFDRTRGFRVSRTTSEDTYTLAIDLDGIAPQEVQVSTQGQWILISREHSTRQEQQDSFDDSRGYMHGFSYSSGTTSRRLSVPPDGDPSAMSREDGKDRILIRIPRVGR